MAQSSPKTTSAARTSAENEAVSLPLAAAALLTSLAGVHAIHLIFLDPAFTTLVLELTVAGSTISYMARRLRIVPNPLEWPAITLFGLIAFMVLTSYQALPIISPRIIGDMHISRIALFLAWLIVGLSFAGSYNVRLLFTAVPSLAAIGLVSTMSADPMIASLFLTYVFATTFMVVHERCLRAASDAVAQGRSPGPTLLLGQLQTVIVCTVAAALIGGRLAGPLRTVGSQIIGNTIPITVPAAGGPDRPSTVGRTYSNPSGVQVGTGPVSLGSQVALRVRAEHGAYWRSSTFDRYTGRGWSHSSGPAMPARMRPEGDDTGQRSGTGRGRVTLWVPDMGLNAVNGPTHTLHQTIRLEGSASFGELVAAAEPRTVRLPTDSTRYGMARYSVDAAGSIQVAPEARQLEYDVDSVVADWTPEQLKRCGTDYPTYVERSLFDTGNMDPGALQRIRSAAVAATRGMQNNHDRVQALAQLISSRCAYNTSAKAVPVNRDVVDYFLFEAKEGYCDSFASALAILCRSIGIPARVASGFVTGQLDPDTGWYVVRDRDRHLWTEVYFAGVGWIPFDATSDAVDKSPRQSNGGGRKASFADLLLRRGWLPPLALAAFLLMLGYVLKVEVLDRLLARRRGEVWSSLPAPNERIARTYLSVCETIARHDAARTPDQTPAEYADALAAFVEQVPGAAAPLRSLTELVTRTCYSGLVATPADVADAAAHQQRLQEALRAAPRRAVNPKPAPGTT